MVQPRRTPIKTFLFSSSQTILGSILFFALPFLLVYAVDSRDSLRDLGKGFDGIAKWQEQHDKFHADDSKKHIDSDMAAATINYQVTDCRATLEDLEKRMRRCEQVSKGAY